MKKIVLVGAVGCGKTTFTQRLHSRDIVYAKTQAIYTDGAVFDTPGEYLEHTFYKHALRLASFEADLVVLLESATAAHTKLPPAFTTFFTKPVIGVVTKIDVATPEQISIAVQRLNQAGVSEIYEVCALTGAGFDAVLERLA